jgi:2-oxoglutarate ferredoxin oxidoreductase subunit beta
MDKLFKHPESLREASTHYCSGCGHGIAHRLIAEVVDELGIREKVIGLAPVGCAVVAYDYWNFDCSEAAHGRALAVATAIKRVRPENIVFTYQGDGDLAAIGTAETIHTANRGENLTVIFINNGHPLKISELLAQLPAVKYVERVGLFSPQEILKAKRAIKQAFQNQIDNLGFSLVEVLSACPTYWGKSPKEAMDWMREAMAKEFPLGRIK